MSLGRIIDTAIGLMLVYLVLSLVATSAMEFIAQFLQLRARNLEQGLRALLTGDRGGAVTDQRLQDLMNHPFIRLVQSPTGNPLARWWRDVRPSYIEATQFQRALIDSLRTGTTGQTIQQVAAAVASLPDGPAKDALTAMLADAQGDLARLKQSIEEWYDAAMDRVAGWYTRKTRAILFWLGLATAIGLNADTFAMGSAFWNSDDLRAIAVNQAALIAAQPDPARRTVPAPGAAPPAATPAPPPAAAQPGATQPPATLPVPPVPTLTSEQIASIRNALTSNGLPLGWDRCRAAAVATLGQPPAPASAAPPAATPPATPATTPPAVARPAAPASTPMCIPGLPSFMEFLGLFWGALLTTAAFGWLVTACAIALGANFWFDMLKRFINIRGTGPVADPATAPAAPTPPAAPGTRT